MHTRSVSLLGLITLFTLPLSALGQETTTRETGPGLDPLRDREARIPTSLFGTYIDPGQWMIYPFAEYDTNDDEEYTPIELGYPRSGFTGEEEFLGKATQKEAVIFVGYGINESLALEFEAEVYASATLNKSPLDTSPVPPRLQESGFAGAEAQLRWMMREETPERRALYSFYEMEFPFQDKKVLIGAQDIEVAAGIGFIRSYSWGTLNGRASIAYDGEENKFELGEYALEYLKRVNDRWRLVATLEGEDDELALIGEAQLTLRPGVILKLNSGFGLTEKAADFAPEIGILFTF